MYALKSSPLCSCRCVECIALLTSPLDALHPSHPHARRKTGARPPPAILQAVASLVACETERQMTWSRLEGLRFHWAVASGPKGHWELPPRGWKTLPDTTGGQAGYTGAASQAHTGAGGEQRAEMPRYLRRAKLWWSQVLCRP